MLYIVFMVVYKVDISVNISFFISTIADPADCFVLYLASCKSFAIRTFSPIKNLTIELLASA